MAVNKCDTPEQLKNNTISFFDLGLDDPIGISALNGSGVGDVLDILLDESDSSKAVDTNESFSISIVGMPNVGKSSLLNSIIQKEQAIVSEVAGTTRDSIDTNIQWHGKTVKIVDTAGLRKKSKVDTDIEFYSSLRAIDSLMRSDVVLFVIDAEKGFTKQDKTIASQIIKKGKSMIILVNKWDLTSKKDILADSFMLDMFDSFRLLEYYPILFVSALTKRRISNILPAAWEVFNCLLYTSPSPRD